MLKRKLLLAVLTASVWGAASATMIGDVVQTGRIGGADAVIVAGAPPDSPAARVDPNVQSSPFNGVVSINIRYANGDSFICSGTMITPTHVVTAAHCVDATGTGQVIDITKPGNDVRIVLNAQPNVGDPGRAIITANEVTIHPNYNGFGICPPGSGIPGQCLNDDIAVIQLGTAVPDFVTKYAVGNIAPSTGSVFTMVGYGTSGDGINGYTVGPAFRTKRSGQNVYDVNDTDDEQFYDPNSPAEVWYYDFDGTVAGYDRDAWCVFAGVCGGTLGNDIETHLGGGDSGGPSFMRDSSGNYILVANNTFSGNVCGWPNANGGPTPCVAGDFGDIGGGILMYSYFDWIRNQTPEPGSIALLGLALLSMAGIRRRRKH